MQPLPLPSVLVTYGTNIVLAVSTSAPSIVFVNECTADTIGVFGVQYPNYRESLFLSTIDPKELPEWTWNFNTRLFEKTPERHLNDEVRRLSALAIARLETITAVVANISRVRLKFTSGIVLQDAVYLEKRMEALAFRDSGYDEKRLSEYPHIVLYADYAGITSKQAADDIIFKSKLYTELLAKTELLRIMYSNKIRGADTPEKVASVLEEFYRDTYVSALV